MFQRWPHHAHLRCNPLSLPAVSCMAFVFPGLVALRATRRRAVPQQECTRWDAALWVCGWVLVTVGLLQMAASIASQFT